MSIELHDRVLRIQRGSEQRFHITNEISCEHSFMYSAYLQAKNALRETIDHTKAFYAAVKYAPDESGSRTHFPSVERRLFEYGGNVILFAAPRGGGKTRTMLSFSYILEHPNEPIDCCSLNEKCPNCTHPIAWLEDSAFYVTDPIAPTVLENGQSILYVVLSRLYEYAEGLLSCDYNHTRITECQRNELYMAFSRCLNGINGLKRNNTSPEDFTILQEISDGLLLRKHFYELVSSILKIAPPCNSGSTKFLVLQFDDADSKIDNTYAVFEDIRKYLLVPNLVILMSADLDSLHKVITQDHLKQFSAIINYVDKDYSQNLALVARKNIDKLIPPSHLVNLPSFGDLSIAEIRRLKLLYVNEKGVCVLNSDKALSGGGQFDLDELVLRLVYRKTHVLFIRPSTYLHNLIPWTPRGLNQLLYILIGMEDIPDIQTFSPVEKYMEEINRQCGIAQRNLRLFTDYFINDWIKVKVKNFDDQRFLTRIAKVRPEERIKEAIAYLKKRFMTECNGACKPTCQDIDECKYKEVFNTDGIHYRESLNFLNKFTSVLMENVCKQDEHLLLFALHTILTLNSHRMIWEQKYMKVQEYVVKKPVSAPIVFCYASDTEMVTSIIQNRQVPYTYTMGPSRFKTVIDRMQIPKEKKDLMNIKEYFSDAQLIRLAIDKNSDIFITDEQCEKFETKLRDYIKADNPSIDDARKWLSKRRPSSIPVKDAINTLKKYISNSQQLLLDAVTYCPISIHSLNDPAFEELSGKIRDGQFQNVHDVRVWLDSKIQG